MITQAKNICYIFLALGGHKINIPHVENSIAIKNGVSGSDAKSVPKAAQKPSALIEDNVILEHSGKKLHAYTTETASPDEIQYTEEDLIKVDQIVKSACSMKGKCMAQGDDHIFDTPGIRKKVNFPARVVVQTPLNDIFSSTTTVTETRINSPGQDSYTRYELFPFKVDMTEPDEEDVDAFDSWFSDGYKPGLIKFKFPPMKDVIKPPFHFGPYVIASKTWWHELRECNVYLRDSHLNICFYYFRKMLRFSSLKSFKCTTTDSFFGSMVRGAYRSCREDIHSISKFKSLVEIANGDCLHCNTKWTEVDNVLIPIMMEKKAHWILAHFSINERTLYVYNPSRLTVRDRVVISDMEAFTHVIPCLMLKLNPLEWSSAHPVERLDPLDVKLVSEIPQDEYGHDCGLFVIKYAELIMRQEPITMMHKFDPNSSRLHLAAQLYKYACEKIIEGYETDYDNVPHSVRIQRKLSASKNILVPNY